MSTRRRRPVSRNSVRVMWSLFFFLFFLFLCFLCRVGKPWSLLEGKDWEGVRKALPANGGFTTPNNTIESTHPVDKSLRGMEKAV